MKWICYHATCGKRNTGTDESPNYEDIIQPTRLEWSEANEEIAKREALGGEYTIVDDGQKESDITPTLEDRIGSLEFDSAETKEALALILSGVTE